VPHAWRNPSEDEDVRIVSELRPELHLEAFMEIGSGLARGLKTDRKGAPTHLMRAVMPTNEAKGDYYLTGVPWPLQRASSAVLGVLAYAGKRLVGYGTRPPR
jgi:hypothetical protein